MTQSRKKIPIRYVRKFLRKKGYRKASQSTTSGSHDRWENEDGNSLILAGGGSREIPLPSLHHLGKQLVRHGVLDEAREIFRKVKKR